MWRWLFFFVLIGSSGVNADTSQTVRFACNYFPPQKLYAPENGTHPGIDVELLQSISEQMNLKAHFEFFPWKRAYAMVQTGEMDALCSCSYLKKREADFIFTDPIGTVSKGLFARSDDVFAGIKTLADLRDKRVGVVSGYNLESELDASGVKKIEQANSEESLFNMLMYKRVDLIYAYEKTTRFAINHQSGPHAIHFLQLETSPYYTCFSRAKADAQQQVDRFNEVLRKTIEAGLPDKINARYLDPALD